MKRILPVVCTLLAALPLAAQMMPDSTVQVVAYWEVGDKMDYTFSEQLYDLDAFDEEIHSNPVSASFEEYVTEEIHLDSGWPIQYLYDRYETIAQGDSFRGIHLTRELVPEEKIDGE